MNCLTCGTENPAGAQFCQSCGVPLATPPSLQCSQCNTSNPPEAAFCSNCGNPLAPSQRPSEAGAVRQEPAVEYMGFWIRFLAMIVDGVIVSIITIVLSLAFPYVGILGGWVYHTLFIGLKGQTPGKMALGIKVINERGEVPGLGYAALREIPGKIISGIVILLGFIWVAFDSRKQAWHDKIARTYVVRAR